MTLHEIAKRANVSTATVSRTINCAPNVTPSVARRVRKVIEEAGYYPNTHARALVSRRSRIFGLMVSEALSLPQRVLLLSITRPVTGTAKKFLDKH